MSEKREFGDFQTPENLATRCVALVAEIGGIPIAVTGRGWNITLMFQKMRVSRTGIALSFNSEYVYSQLSAYLLKISPHGHFDPVL
jgi:hypothetical protein